MAPLAWGQPAPLASLLWTQRGVTSGVASQCSLRGCMDRAGEGCRLS
jgi:hypothetical protein